MGISAKIIADSIAKDSRKRVTTFELKYPRMVHSELLTHRMFSRNSASSRAIPVAKMLKAVKEDPAMPVFWGRNQPGMQAATELEGLQLQLAKERWLLARDAAVEQVEALLALDLHKQLANRLTESFMHSVTILTGTEFGNFYNLRCHPAAQPEMRALAEAMWAAQDASIPTELAEGQWHLPYVTEEDILQYGYRSDDPYFLQKFSVARCARVSYLNHDGTTPNHAKDIELHDRLLKDGHASPFEHQATPFALSHFMDPTRPSTSSNLLGFTQYRKLLPSENRTVYKR